MARIPDSRFVRLLADLLSMPPRRGKDAFQVAERWLTRSSCGRQLRRHFAGEAGLVAMAASMVIASGVRDL